MRLLRSFPVATFALVLVAIVGFCAAERSVTLLLVAGTIAALSWYVTEGPRGRTLPRWASNVLVLAVSASVVWDVLARQGDIFGVLGRFCTWLTLVKLYERRSARDHAHLMALSLLLMLVGCLKSTDLVFGIVMLIYVVLGLYVLLLFQLFAAHESASAERQIAAPTGALAAPAMRPVVGRHMLGQFRSTTGMVGVVAILISVIVFLSFPRHVGRNLFATDAIINPLGRVTGYSESVDLVSGDRISTSRRPIFDVQLRDESDRPIAMDGPLLLRGAVLDRYEDGSWTSSAGRDRQRVVAEAGVTVPLSDRSYEGDAGRLIRQHIRFRTPTTDLFSLYVPVAVELDRRQSLSFSPSLQVVDISEDGSPVRSCTITARIDPDDNAVRAASAGAPPPRLPPQFRNGPAAQRFRELAIRILEDAGLPSRWPTRGDWRQWALSASEAIAEHLRTNFTYTLDRSDIVLGDMDPIVEFVFGSRTGHCEFFASALVALCESIEIDARVVTGYVAYAYDEEEQTYRVTAGNAHAWTEVRTGRFEYTPVDPTPAAQYTTDVGDAALADRIGWLYDQLEGSWSGAIIGYDEASQQELLSGLDEGWSERFGSALGSVRQWASDVNRRFNVGPAGYIWLGLLGLAAGLAVVAMGRVYRRMRRLRQLFRFRRRRAVRVPWRLGFYLDMQIILRRAGRVRPAWQSPLAFADTLAGERPDAGELVRRVTRIYYAARYGGRELGLDEVGEARRLVRELAQALRVRA